MGVQSYGPQNQGVHKWEADDGAPGLQAVRNLRWTLTMGLSTWSLCLVVPQARLGGLQLNAPCLWVWHEFKFHSCILGNHNHMIHTPLFHTNTVLQKPFFFGVGAVDVTSLEDPRNQSDIHPTWCLSAPSLILKWMTVQCKEALTLRLLLQPWGSPISLCGIHMDFFRSS